MNKSELSLGSLVVVDTDGVESAPCEVVELKKYMLSIRQGGSCRFVSYDSVKGFPVTGDTLRHLGFTDSDLKGWKLVYYFGDMRLYYRYYYKDGYAAHASFRFTTPYRKSYVHISCQYVHELQNIMTFLTGGELEFKYKESNLEGAVKWYKAE